jgi:hypothetical protein
MGLGYARPGGMLERYLHRREGMVPGLVLQMCGSITDRKGNEIQHPGRGENVVEDALLAALLAARNQS